MSLRATRLPLKALQLVDRSLQWSSAVIVLGIVSYFINKDKHGEHIIYEESIAAISVAVFLPAFGTGLNSRLARWIIYLDFAFSYLWLTAFIFTAQDYNWQSCYAHAPPGGSCSLKKTSEAFTFLTFFFTLVGIFLDISQIYEPKDDTVPPQGTKGTSESTNGGGNASTV